MTDQNAIEFINNIDETKDTIIHISHTDLDGYGASYIVSQHLSTFNLVQCNINYGNLIETLETLKIDELTKIIITDINLTLSECKQLDILTHNWMVVDHHATGQKSSERYRGNYYLDTSYAATKLIFNILSDSKFNSETSLFNISKLVDTYDVWRQENDILFKQGILISNYIHNSPFEDSDLKLKYANWIFSVIVLYLFEHGVQKTEIRYQDMFITWLPTINNSKFMKDEYLPTNVKCALLHVDIMYKYIVHKTDEYVIFSGLSSKITQYVFNELFKQLEYADKVLINLNKRNGNVAFRSGNGKASELAKLCSGGGHPNAAGAKINVDDGEKYLDKIIKLLTMKKDYLLTDPDYLPHIKRYESDEALMKNTLKGDGFNCPHCGHSPKTISESIIGIAPITTTLDKYPNKDFDMAYVWLEKYKCPVCGTKFYIENGT